MKIAVTGGTGFLGKEIVTQLLDAGHDVVAISRGQSSAVDLPIRATFIHSDIRDHAKLTKNFCGCDAVIHVAALSAPWGRRSDFIRQNAEGTASAVRSANSANVQRLIHVSSSSVCFAFEDRLGVKESDVLPQPVNAYAESKQRAELAVAGFKGPAFILRPRGIYGPNDPHLLPRLLRVMQSRPLPLLRQGKAMVDVTDVSVVAHAIVQMTGADPKKAGIYNISHGEPMSIRELVGRISIGLNLANRWRSVPMPIAFASARLLESWARLDPWQREPMVTAYGLGLFAYSHTLDISKAARELNWTPKHSLDFGLQRTFRAFAAVQP
jgi:nucleoside-diphosphate-sugar epimerase